LSRPPKADRLELLLLPERSEGKEFDTAQLRIPPERSEEWGALGAGSRANQITWPHIQMSLNFALYSGSQLSKIGELLRASLISLRFSSSHRVSKKQVHHRGTEDTEREFSFFLYREIPLEEKNLSMIKSLIQSS
jgi:hypothetical protein